MADQIRFDILSLFPEMFRAVLATSIPGRAREGGFAEYHLHDIRRFADNRHLKVDDRPFGGGPGMVMMCQPLYDCVEAVEAMDERPARRLLLSPQGEPLKQRRVEELARERRLLLIAGHYEGIDERVIDELAPLEISLGDYVLSGGELPVMVLIDAIVRLIPGVLGHEDSAAEDSFSPVDRTDRERRASQGRERAGTCRSTDPDEGEGEGEGEEGEETWQLLDCPHYTRPRVWRDRAVPDVLLSGDHGAVAEWRREQRIARTRSRRPDLLENSRDP